MAFFIIVSISFSGVAQEASIVHYQRKEKLQQVILPNDTFRSNEFTILVPDSIYSAGKITIKILSLNNIKLTAEFNFSQNKFTSVEYIIKKKHMELLEKEITSKTLIQSLDEQELKKINLSITTETKGRKVYYKLSML